MTKKVYFIENSSNLDKVLLKITNTFPCFLRREFIEMDYSEVAIEARNEDIMSIEGLLAPLM